MTRTSLITLATLLASGCTTIQRAPYDPCARQPYRGSKPAGQIIVACHQLSIPSRARVVDAATGAALPAVAVLHGQNVIDEPIEDGPALGRSSPDGEVNLVVDLFVHTANPYTACFRQSFPGILIEFQQDGYARYQCCVPLPERKGLAVELGTVYLEPIEEQDK
jgi:hypothetical protein